jgi:hypothetical protein
VVVEKAIPPVSSVGVFTTVPANAAPGSGAASIPTCFPWVAGTPVLTGAPATADVVSSLGLVSGDVTITATIAATTSSARIATGHIGWATRAFGWSVPICVLIAVLPSSRVFL